MSKSKRLIFFGNERLATGVTTKTPVLRSLIEGGYEIAALVVNQRPMTSRKERPLEVVALASQHSIPVLNAAETNAEKLESLQAEAAILAAHGRIMSEEEIDAFPKGIINIHPSLLPLYRGSSPIEQAILDGCSEIGVSLMSLVARMDAGPIYAQKALKLSGSETKQDLADRLGGMGAEMLVDSLEHILDGALMATPQNESEASYTKVISKGSGEIDWSKAAEQIEREVRAYFGWPKCRANLFGKEVIVTKVRATSVKGAGLSHECGNGYIEVLELIAPSGRRMSGADFLRGYGE